MNSVLDFLDESPAIETETDSVSSADGAPLTDAGNAERFAHDHNGYLRWVPEWKTWMRFDGVRWCRTHHEETIRLGIQTARAMLVRASDRALDQKEAAALASHAVRTENAGKLEAMIRLSRGLLVERAENFDRDLYALNAMNVTIDLRTGRARPHVKEDMLTALAPVNFDPLATAPTWERFLERILPEPDVRSWLQRFLGYSLTGSTGEQIITFLYGSGANGKSTCLGIIQDAFGDYAFQGPPGLLLASDRGDELGRRQRASLLGRRLVSCQEVEVGRYLNETQVKQITGSDRITAARLYEAEMEFTPTHKLVVACNAMPQVKGQDHAIWRRIRLVPFTVTIPPEERDPSLPEKLRAEMPGILAWCVRGCLLWQRDGLVPPDVIVKATRGYQEDEDKLAEFLELHTEPGEAVAVQELHGAYRTWCNLRDEHPWSVKAFGDALVERRVATRGKRLQVRVFKGVRLKRDTPGQT